MTSVRDRCAEWLADGPPTPPELLDLFTGEVEPLVADGMPFDEAAEIGNKRVIAKLRERTAAVRSAANRAQRRADKTQTMTTRGRRR